MHLITFVDSHGHQCSLDPRTPAAGILLGTDVDFVRVGRPWTRVPFTDVARMLGKEGQAVRAESHMRLGPDCVSALLPMLEEFANTGDLVVGPARNARGVRRVPVFNFEDGDGKACSLLLSCAPEPAPVRRVWLGTNVTLLTVGDDGDALETISLDEVCRAAGYSGRAACYDFMHLSRAHVVDLVGMLRTLAGAAPE